MMLKQTMLTTFDNPFNPFEQFNEWFMFDIEKGYQTCERLAKVVKLSDEMTQNEIDEEIDRAMDEIIKEDFLNLYVKAFDTSEDVQENTEDV